MKKILLAFNILYYLLLWGIYWLFLRVLAWCGNAVGIISDNSGIADIGTLLSFLALWLIITPVLISVLMRFSLFKWYIDPIAAAEIPLYLYALIVISKMKYADNLLSALKQANESLNVDYGWLFMVGLFVIGILMSFSIKRKNGESISFRILAKILKEEK